MRKNNVYSQKKKSKNHLDYSIGLDIGVASVGWACLTPDYRIPKHNGRYAVGVREFDAAETAEFTRIQRGTRRRYNRRIKRIQLLQQTITPLFKNEPGYFIELDEKEKHFWRNSNRFENNSLSETLKHLGMNPHHYPTIYHLRNALLKKDETFHPRLIYLALHHLVKYRGHFLNENMTWAESASNKSLQSLLTDYFNELIHHEYADSNIDNKDFEYINNILLDNHLTRSDKRKHILEVIGREFREPISLIVGLKSNVSRLFFESEQIIVYKDEKLGINLADDDISEVFDKLTDKERVLIEKAQVIYQTILLNDLLGDARCVSEAKVIDYDQFGQDLKVLKDIYNEHFGEKAYRDMFITSKENQRKYNETRDVKLLCQFDKFLKAKRAHEESFYKLLDNELKKLQKKQSITNDEQILIEQIRVKLTNQQFLRKLKTKDNAAIPYQNNVYEAETILRNQQKYYPEITDKIINKIKEIISFRIPYYIGPLVKDNENAKFGWATRKNENKHINPWNFYEVIDKSQSAEDFINKMTGYCTYLINEKVLPKHSLLYERFELLNELNGIQIRSSYDLPDKKYRLAKEEKEWLIDHVFSKRKTVTHQTLKEALKSSPFKHIIIDESTESLKNIYGTQKEDRFGSSLSTLIDMRRIFGSLINVKFDMLEEIIYWITVFEEKDIIEVKIKEKYPEINEDQIRSLINLNYTGWGRLSKCLIDEFPADKVNQLTILDIMQAEPKVFMEVLSEEKYDLNERFSKINVRDKVSYTKIKYQDIAELPGSPALKKGIWQAILLIEELVEIFGEPENIMIEFARGDGVAERTKKREERLKEIEKAISRDEKELKSFLKEHLGRSDIDYNNNRLYLYITQQGKCLYSGERLYIDQLQNYEVDHILPRSFVKDDSIDNLALVKKYMNQDRGFQKMPLEMMNSEEKIKQKLIWRKLLDNKLMSQKKYNLLLKETLTDQDKEGFFARQLVETRQITKHVKDLLEERFERADIHTVNANIVSRLREHTNTIKIRNLNNKHHAVDATLTALIIQFIINQYGANFLDFNFKYREAQKKWRDMLIKYGKHFFLFADIDKYDKFAHFQTGELLTGRQFLSMINDEMPWQTTKKIGTNEAAFYDQTLYSPKETMGRNPQYTSSKVAKGVHSDLGRASSYIVSYKYVDKRNREKTESKVIDLFVIEKYQTRQYTNRELAHFLARKEVSSKGKVVAAKIHTRILKHQLITVNEHPLYFVSAGEMNNAKQFRPNLDVMKNLYKILNKKETTKEFLKQTFSELSQCAINQYRTYLPESRIKAIENYVNKVIDLDTFNKGLEEMLKMASASAARSSTFGGRYERRIDPTKARFIHQSITGLNYRKPQSYKNELWMN